MILQVFWHTLACIQACFDLSVSDITTYNNRAVQTQTCANRILGQYLTYIRHWLIEVNAYSITFACLTEFLWNKTCRIIIHLLNPDTILIDLTLDITVSRATYAQADWATCAVARQTNHTDIVCHVLTAKLCTQTNLICLFEQLLFELNIAERTTSLITCSRQCIVVVSRSQLHGQQVLLCTRTANHKSDVVWRASRCTKALHLLYEEWNECARILDTRLGLLIEVSFVSRATTFGHTKEVIFHTFSSLQINLCWQIALGIHLVIHIEWCVL